MRIKPLCYLTFYAIEGTTTDEKNVIGVEMHIVLIGMLASTLWRNVYDRTFQQFEQTLLYTLTRNIACDTWIVTLAGYLVYFINKNNATFSCGLIVVSYLQQAGENALHILTHITRLGKHRCIHNGERNIQKFGNCTRQKGLSRSG